MSGTYIWIVIVFPVHKHDCYLKHGAYVPRVWILHVLIINDNRYNNNKPFTTRRFRTRSRMYEHSVRLSHATNTVPVAALRTTRSSVRPSSPRPALPRRRQQQSVLWYALVRVRVSFTRPPCVPCAFVLLRFPPALRVPCIPFVSIFGLSVSSREPARPWRISPPKPARDGVPRKAPVGPCLLLRVRRPRWVSRFWNVYGTKRCRTESDLPAYAYRQYRRMSVLRSFAVMLCISVVELCYACSL